MDLSGSSSLQTPPSEQFYQPSFQQQQQHERPSMSQQEILNEISRLREITQANRDRTKSQRQQGPFSGRQ